MSTAAPSSSSPPPQYVELQRLRRGTDEKTVLQLFEDSDYIGDFEQLDAVTAPSFVTEKTLANLSIVDDMKQKKKLGEFKKVKLVRNFYGRHPKMSTAAPSSSSPPPQYVVIKTKAPKQTVVKKPSNVPLVPPQYGREPRIEYGKRGFGSIKAIRQPFVSDTWSNAGKQAFYHELPTTCPFQINPPSSSLPIALVDNSITRTDQPDLVLGQPHVIAEVEALLRNIIANDGIGPVEETTKTSTSLSTTSVTMVGITATATEPLLPPKATSTEEKIDSRRATGEPPPETTPAVETTDAPTTTSEPDIGKETSTATAESKELETTTELFEPSKESTTTVVNIDSNETSEPPLEAETTTVATTEEISDPSVSPSSEHVSTIAPSTVPVEPATREAQEDLATSAKTITTSKQKGEGVAQKRKKLKDEEMEWLTSKSSPVLRAVQLNSTAAVKQERLNPENPVSSLTKLFCCSQT
ncbi:unnamed protein product [Strongylus vulgaris]|uniref:Uncharacterized protein n=1 Tax=Strongylus vulgaris TaxID=40348 RepID=A0A3P7JG53_STRVU|nr:unnamed protein product [Strongylus vulgaris]